MRIVGGGYFCKPFDGQCGGGIFKIQMVDDGCQIDGKLFSRELATEEISERLQTNHYIIQELVEQHDIINKIYDKQICKKYENENGVISAFELSDKTLDEVIENSEDGKDAIIKIDSDLAKKLALKVAKMCKKYGVLTPKILVPMDFRQLFFGILSMYFRDIVVLAQEEICSEVEVLAQI